MSILGIVLWQPHLGGRTASFARTEGDLSSHPFDEVAADGEPEAETPGGALAPVEALEEVGELLGIGTNPGVAAYLHSELYLCALRQRLDPLGGSPRHRLRVHALQIRFPPRGTDPR